MKLFIKTILILAIAFIAGLLIITALSTSNFIQAAIGVGIGFIGFFILGRGKGSAQREKLKVAYGFLTVVLFAVFFLSIVFGGLGGVITSNQPSINLAQFLLSFWVGGIVMTIVSGTFSTKEFLTKSLFNAQVRYIVGSFAMFFLTNLLVPPTVPVFLKQSVLILPQGGLSDLGKFTTTIIGVPEETVMRGWLAPWLGNISKTGVWGGTVGSAVIFTIYHLFVYGDSPVLMTIIFADGLVQGFAALKTRTLDTTIVNHVGNNFISVYSGI